MKVIGSIHTVGMYQLKGSYYNQLEKEPVSVFNLFWCSSLPWTTLVHHHTERKLKESSWRLESNLGCWAAVKRDTWPFSACASAAYSALKQSWTGHHSPSVFWLHRVQYNKLEFLCGNHVILTPFPEVLLLCITSLRMQFKPRILIFGQHFHYHKNICALLALNSD